MAFVGLGGPQRRWLAAAVGGGGWKLLYFAIMSRFVYFLALATTALASRSFAQSTGVTHVTYMQIFFEGPNWLADRRVLAYSPAFRGKTGEMVQETDSTRALSPGALLGLSLGDSTMATAYVTTTVTENAPDGAFVTALYGQRRRQTAATERSEEARRFNQGFRQLEVRADLARAALGRALDETAVDGWEVVQMTASGNAGALVYLLRRR